MILRYQDRVYNLCYRLLGNEEDALDLSQEVFLTCFRKLDRYEERSNFYTWLYRMVVNLSKNFYKYQERRGRSKTESLDEPIKSGSEKMEKQVDKKYFHFKARVIQHELDHLSGKCVVGEKWKEEKYGVKVSDEEPQIEE